MRQWTTTASEPMSLSVILQTAAATAIPPMSEHSSEGRCDLVGAGLHATRAVVHGVVKHAPSSAGRSGECGSCRQLLILDALKSAREESSELAGSPDQTRRRQRAVSMATDWPRI